MAKRTAYAITTNGKTAFRFGNVAIRDLVVSMLDGIETATCKQYREVERRENMRDEWGYDALTGYYACDMRDCDYWGDQFDAVTSKALVLNIDLGWE